MIYHPINKLKEAGITQILIVTGTEHMGAMVQCLGSGHRFGCEFTYKVQDEAGGIAQALGLAKNFCGQDSFCVILGDNIFSYSLNPLVKEYQDTPANALITLTRVVDPTRFGVAIVNTLVNRLETIREKPTKAELSALQEHGEPYAVTGIYFYDPSVFDIISTLKPSGRNELEITDVNLAYLNNDVLNYKVMDGWWTDAGTPESLALATRLVTGLD
jgi:glucose-1-phosphate thymidylyltransferase